MNRAMSAVGYGPAGAGGRGGVPAASMNPSGPQQQLQQRSRSFAADSLRQNLERSLYLDFDRGAGGGLADDGGLGSPSSDNILFDHMCYATTPSSSNGNSDLEMNVGGGPQQPVPPPPPSSRGAAGAASAASATSPTSRLLLEYEMHLRNTLAKGLDAESCSLHTFEALLTQSMEDLGILTDPFFCIPFSFFLPPEHIRANPKVKE